MSVLSHDSMKIVLFLPYFGALPTYFKAFLYSCRHLDGFIDFIIFTDDISIKDFDLPNNFRVEIWSYDKMSQLIRTKLGKKLFSAYKLCDYKPAYGHLFEEYTKQYEYWGYCDADMMFGDIVGYLRSINYTLYERVGKMGHFTIYRNNEKCKFLYRKTIEGLDCLSNFDFVTGTTYACNFDECGMNSICKTEGLLFWDSIPLLNTSVGYKHLHSWEHRTSYQLWTWENGHVYSNYFDENGEIKKEECSYLHFMMHKLQIKRSLSNYLYITHDGIFTFDPDNIAYYLKQFGKGDTEEEHLETVRSFRKKRVPIYLKRIYTEFRHCGFKAFSNMYRRLIATYLTIQLKPSFHN